LGNGCAFPSDFYKKTRSRARLPMGAAFDGGGRFLDAWVSKAADMGWTPGELFDVTAGLVWQLVGERV
jgi:hypothetical protein